MTLRDELASIVSVTGVAHVEFREQIASTNDLALEQCCSKDLPTPLLVLTDRQIAGRGRGKNQWQASPGALTFSLVVDPQQLQLDSENWPLISLSAGVAVCEVLERLAQSNAFHLKWPNDIFVNDGKISGILVEVSPSLGRRVVVGIGINVNNSFQHADGEQSFPAISLADVTQRQWEIRDVLTEVTRSVLAKLTDLVEGKGEIVAAMNQRCYLNGREVVIALGKNQIRGSCLGIDPQGALLVSTQAGTRRVYGGVVQSFSPNR